MPTSLWYRLLVHIVLSDIRLDHLGFSMDSVYCGCRYDREAKVTSSHSDLFCAGVSAAIAPAHDDDVVAALTAVPSQHCGRVDIRLLSSIAHTEFMVSLMSWLRASIAKVGRRCRRYGQIERHQSDPREDHHISQQVHPSCLKSFLPNTGDGGLLFARGVKVEGLRTVASVVSLTTTRLCDIAQEGGDRSEVDEVGRCRCRLR